MADDPPAVTPKNETHAPVISPEPPPEREMGMAHSVSKPPAGVNLPKSNPILDALASIFLLALFIALAGGLGFAAYWLMR
jgi:hypothetical protein